MYDRVKAVFEPKQSSLTHRYLTRGAEEGKLIGCNKIVVDETKSHRSRRVQEETMSSTSGPLKNLTQRAINDLALDAVDRLQA